MYKTVREALEDKNVPVYISNALKRHYYYPFYKKEDKIPDDSFDLFLEGLKKPYDQFNKLWYIHGIGIKSFLILKSIFVEEENECQ